MLRTISFICAFLLISFSIVYSICFFKSIIFLDWDHLIVTGFWNNYAFHVQCQPSSELEFSFYMARDWKRLQFGFGSKSHAKETQRPALGGFQRFEPIFIYSLTLFCLFLVSFCFFYVTLFCFTPESLLYHLFVWYFAAWALVSGNTSTNRYIVFQVILPYFPRSKFLD